MRPDALAVPAEPDPPERCGTHKTSKKQAQIESGKVGTDLDARFQEPYRFAAGPADDFTIPHHAAAANERTDGPSGD